MAGSVDELWCERLHPPVDGHVINGYASFGKQILDIAIGQAVAQVPAHGDRDDLTREPIARGRSRGSWRRGHHLSVLAPKTAGLNATAPCEAFS
jgi:hypothetical protein